MIAGVASRMTTWQPVARKWVETRRETRNRNLPLALAINFVLAKRDVLEFALAIGLLNPATDVIIRVPPVEV